MSKLNRFHLNGLRALEVVGRLGGLAPAAEEMGISAGAVSQHIIKAERQLGYPVFRRTPGGMVATPGGERLLKRLGQGFREITLGVEGPEGAGAEILHVSCTPVFAGKWLVPRLPEFLTANTGCHVQIAAGLELSHLERSGTDAAIRVGKGSWPGTKAALLVRQRIAPVCAPALARRLQTPRDLLGVPIIRNQNMDEGWGAWLSHYGLTEDQLSPGPALSDYSLCTDAALAGLGVMMGSQIFTLDAIRSGLLVRPFAHQIPSGFDLWFVTPAARGTDRKVQRFRRWIAARLAEDFPEEGAASG